MILRLLKPTSGAITFGDQDIAAAKGAELKAYYRTVQGVFQDPFSSFNPIFKVDHVFDVLRGSYFKDVPETEWDAKVAQALDDVNLDAGQVLRKYPHQLSGGQLQRALVARALLLDIRMLVADEIISMLDASTRIDVLNLLGDLKARGLGILFITHDLSLGNYISDRTVILRRGRVVEQGATERVFGDPLHPYTQMLLASVPRVHERWSTDRAAPVVAGEALRAGPCRFHLALRERAAGTGPGPSMVEIGGDHLVACAHIDDPAGCPEASIAA